MLDEVNYDTNDPAELFIISVAEVRVEGDRTSVLQTETFRNLTMEPNTPNNAVEVVNKGSRLVQLDRAGLTALPSPFVATFKPAAPGTLGGALPSPVAVPAADAAVHVPVPGGPAGKGQPRHGARRPTGH